jgi:ligand-binding SRPBCC domain-containing protein
MITFKRHSGIYTLKAESSINIPIDKAWAYFSNPSNLSKITPESMGFITTSENTESMFSGQIISYIVKPILGIKTNWVTEITHVDEPNFFVDEQRFGPYSMWHHEHHFIKNGNLTQMIDKISFKIPFGILGHLAFPIIVKPQLLKIFNYRQTKLDQLFNS